jgi:hypothetical protein
MVDWMAWLAVSELGRALWIDRLLPVLVRFRLKTLLPVLVRLLILTSACKLACVAPVSRVGLKKSPLYQRSTYAARLHAGMQA